MGWGGSSFPQMLPARVLLECCLLNTCPKWTLVWDRLTTLAVQIQQMLWSTQPQNFCAKEFCPATKLHLSALSPCPFPPSFCLETIITGPSYAVTPSPQLCSWPCWTWSGHWKFTLLFHSPLLSPSQGSKRLDPGWPTGKKGPSLLLAGDANTQETDRGICIRDRYIYNLE